MSMHSNAPATWPELPPGLVQSGDPTEMIGGWLHAQFKKRGSGARITGLHRQHLLAGGILYVSIAFEENGVPGWIYVYPEVKDSICAHFAGVSRLAKELGIAQPVYYAPAPLTQAPPVTPLRPFSGQCLRVLKDVQLEGTWAMWWATERDKSFVASPTIRCIDQTYTQADGIGTYLLAQFAAEIGENPKRSPRIGMPAERVAWIFEGPDRMGVYLTVSQEKGFQFRFNAGDTPVAYRDTFWRLFADYVSGIRKSVEEEGAPLDDGPQRQSIGWWQVLKQAASKPDTSMEMLGAITATR